MELGLQDQIAIVTGGASGIGRGISAALGRNGVNVLLTSFKSVDGA